MDCSGVSQPPQGNTIRHSNTYTVIHDVPKRPNIVLRHLGLGILGLASAFAGTHKPCNLHVPGTQTTPGQQRSQSTNRTIGQYFEGRCRGGTSPGYRAVIGSWSSDIEADRDGYHRGLNSRSSEYSMLMPESNPQARSLPPRYPGDPRFVEYVYDLHESTCPTDV